MELFNNKELEFNEV